MKAESLVLKTNGVISLLGALSVLPAGGRAAASGFLLGGLIGSINFVLIIRNVHNILGLPVNQAIKGARRGHLLRMTLAVMALGFGLVRPDVANFWMIFCGLLGVKISIFALDIRGELGGDSGSV